MSTPSLRCKTCGRLQPSIYYMRAPQLCINCFPALPEEERKRVEAEHPKAEWEIPEEERPLPDRATIRITALSHIWIAVGWGFILRTAFRAIVLKPPLLYLLPILFLFVQAARFWWSYLRSPMRIEKIGGSLFAYYLGGKREEWPIEGLWGRGRFWSWGTPWLIEIHDATGQHLAGVWWVYMSGGELLKRLIPLRNQSGSGGWVARLRSALASKR